MNMREVKRVIQYNSAVALVVVFVLAADAFVRTQNGEVLPRENWWIMGLGATVIAGIKLWSHTGMK